MRLLILLPILGLLTSCSSIRPIGSVGPKHLQVYSIKDGDFLSENSMLIVLNNKGDVAAYTGGTVTGVGTLGLQTAGTLVSAGAVVVGAKSIQHGLQNTNVNGIPKSFDVNTKSSVDVSGSIKKLD